MREAAAIDLGVEQDDGLTTVAATNDDAFKRILTLYARPGQTIVDPTFGQGVFWRRIDRSLYDVHATDLSTEGPDLRALPHADGSVEMVVLDPPYRYTPARNQKHEALDERYALQATAATRTQGVIALYVTGMVEAHRVLRLGGILVVKCQDTVQDGRNIWVHCELMAAAPGLGFACRDLLVVHPPSVTRSRWPHQRHLRKAHSYFLVFRKGGHFPFGIPSVERRDGGGSDG